MTGFSDGFRHFILPSEDETRVAMTTGLIVLDTNVLLSAYRFASKAREELISVLDRLSSRLWIPHQVALEFHRNRVEVMGSQGSPYTVVVDAIGQQQETLHDALAEKIRQLANRAALTDELREEALVKLHAALTPLESFIQELHSNNKLNEAVTDPILDRFQQIFDGRVGEPLNGDDKISVLAEAARRIKEKVPPGYRDAGKHGDYFIWRQTLEEVKRRGEKNIVFVTGDVKEDWYLRVHGKSLAARPELAQEAFDVAGARLILMTIKGFLINAETYLDATVSDDTYRQADDIPDASDEAPEAAADPLAALRASLRRAQRHTERIFPRELRSSLASYYATHDPSVDVQYAPQSRTIVVNDHGRRTHVLTRFTTEKELDDDEVVDFLSTIKGRRRMICVTNGVLSESAQEFVFDTDSGASVEFVTWAKTEDTPAVAQKIGRPFSL